MSIQNHSLAAKGVTMIDQENKLVMIFDEYPTDPENMHHVEGVRQQPVMACNGGGGGGGGGGGN